MARTSRRRELKSEINIVPLLDVLLVLLLIFMATAPIISQSVEVELPDATDTQTVSSSDNPPIILEVSGVGQYNMRLDGEVLELLPPEQIAAEAKAQLAKNPKAIFLIGGQKKCLMKK